MMTLPESTLNVIDRNLLISAAFISRTRFALSFDNLASDAQDLYQHGIKRILEECKENDTPSFMATKGKWRMRNALKHEWLYSEHVGTEADFDLIDDDQSLFELVPDDSEDPETGLIIKDSLANFLTVLNDLQPEHRVVIRLLQDGYGLPEIAEKIGISYDAVWKRINKIRNILTSSGITPSLA